MARLFIAVWPPEEVAAELRSLHRKDQQGVRFVPPENWHVTLRFLGESNPDDVVDAVDQVRLPPAHAQVGPGVDVLAERMLVIPVNGLDELADAVTRPTRAIGEPARKRFVGHLTLARLKAHASMPRVLGAFVDAAFPVEEVALVQSRLDPDGARYETLHTWPVDAPRP